MKEIDENNVTKNIFKFYWMIQQGLINLIINLIISSMHTTFNAPTTDWRMYGLVFNIMRTSRSFRFFHRRTKAKTLFMEGTTRQS